MDRVKARSGERIIEMDIINKGMTVCAFLICW